MSSSIESLISREYEAGFVTDIESDTLPPGLSERTMLGIETTAAPQAPAWFRAPTVADGAAFVP